MSLVERTMHWQIIHIPQAIVAIPHRSGITLNFHSTSTLSQSTTWRIFGIVRLFDCPLDFQVGELWNRNHSLLLVVHRIVGTGRSTINSV